jgi:hypothetical protein
MREHTHRERERMRNDTVNDFATVKYADHLVLWRLEGIYLLQLW